MELTFAESAAILGVSDEFLARYVAHEVRFVRCGREKLVAVRELDGAHVSRKDERPDPYPR